MGLGKALFRYIISGGDRRKRMALGFSLGKLEHTTRKWGFVLLGIGLFVSAYSMYLDSDLGFLVGLGIAAFAFLVEGISYCFHFCEKRAMDKIRRGRI